MDIWAFLNYKGFVQLKGGRFLLQGPRIPLQRALFDFLIVGHSPGFNCIGPLGTSKDVGLGRT